MNERPAEQAIEGMEPEGSLPKLLKCPDLGSLRQEARGPDNQGEDARSRDQARFQGSARVNKNFARFCGREQVIGYTATQHSLQTSVTSCCISLARRSKTIRRSCTPNTPLDHKTIRRGCTPNTTNLDHKP